MAAVVNFFGLAFQQRVVDLNLRHLVKIYIRWRCGIVMHLVINKPTLTTLHAVYPMAPMSLLGNTPRKNWGIHIAAFLSRQPLVNGERLVRYEVNAVMNIRHQSTRDAIMKLLYNCPPRQNCELTIGGVHLLHEIPKINISRPHGAVGPKPS